MWICIWLYNIRCYQSGTRVDLGSMAMKEYSAFPKLQHYWSLIIRLFSVIYQDTLWGGGGSYPYEEMQSVYFTASANWDIWYLKVALIYGIKDASLRLGANASLNIFLHIFHYINFDGVSMLFNSRFLSELVSTCHKRSTFIISCSTSIRWQRDLQKAVWNRQSFKYLHHTLSFENISFVQN